MKMCKYQQGFNGHCSWRTITNECLHPKGKKTCVVAFQSALKAGIS